MSSQFVAVGVLTKSPGEIKSREVELGSHSRMDCLAATCFSSTVAYRTLSL